MKGRKIVFCLAFTLAVMLILGMSCLGAEAFVPGTAERFEVAPVFFDNMVFQQNEEIKIWGTSDCEGEYVNAKLGDSYGSGMVTEGKWEIIFAPRVYSKVPQVLEVFGGPGSGVVSFENIHIGDVWWVVGQSNVAFAASASRDWESFAATLTGEEKIFIHEVDSPVSSGKGHDRWRKLNLHSGGSGGALAVFTAKKLSDALQNEIPIGIVNMGYSGAELSQFMPPRLTRGVPFVTKKHNIYREILSHYEAFPIKGMIWYQGEADETVYSVYAKKLSSFIEWLREKKNQINRDFPVYAVELPPCFPDPNDPGRQFAQFGNVRAEIGFLPGVVENFYVCPTSDLWNEREYANNLHPDNKLVIATRLLGMILSKEYGFGGSEQFFAPLLKEYAITEDEKCVTLTFTAPIVAEKTDGFMVIGEKWASLSNAVVDIKENIITVRSDAPIKIVRYNTKTENVFGEDIFLQGQNAMPVPAVSVTFESLDPPIRDGFIYKVYNKIMYHRKLLFILFLGAVLVFGLWLYRKKRIGKMKKDR